MGSFMTVENITEIEFKKLQQMGWILISVDNFVADRLVYSFKREW